MFPGSYALSSQIHLLNSNRRLIRRYRSDRFTPEREHDNNNPATCCQPKGLHPFLPTRLDLDHECVRVEDGIFGLSRTDSVPCQVSDVSLVLLKLLFVPHSACNDIVYAVESACNLNKATPSIYPPSQPRHPDFR